ncbi:hypothetical protein D3C84_1127610 [compost metagenome]
MPLALMRASVYSTPPVMAVESPVRPLAWPVPLLPLLRSPPIWRVCSTPPVRRQWSSTLKVLRTPVAA